MEEPTTIIRDFSDDLTETQKAVLEETNPPAIFTLSDGMAIGFKKPSGLVSFKIARYLGAEDSMNQAMNLYYRMLFSLDSINGTKISDLNGQLQVEALGHRLGEENFNEALAKFFEWSGMEPGAEDPAKK